MIDFAAVLELLNSLRMDRTNKKRSRFFSMIACYILAILCPDSLTGPLFERAKLRRPSLEG